MRRMVWLTAALAGSAILLEFACGGDAMAQDKPAGACCAKAEDAAIACTIADASVMAERKAETQRLFSAALERVETDDGFRFKFDRSMAEALFDYAQFESECCAFIEFTMTFERNHGHVWLELSGSKDARAVIESMLQAEDAV